MALEQRESSTRSRDSEDTATTEKSAAGLRIQDYQTYDNSTFVGSIGS